MAGPFGRVADQQMTGAAKAKERGKIRTAARRVERDRATMMPTPLEKKQRDAAIQMKIYRQWKRGIRAEIIESHGSDFADLLRLIRNLEWPNAEAVVDFVRRARWLLRADEDTRFETLRFIDSSLCRARVRYGLPEFDDGLGGTVMGLPGEPLVPFTKIRRMLMRE